jgi:hypothetical protein
MKVRMLIAAAGAALILGSAGPLVAQAAASTHGATRTLTLTARTLGDLSFGQTRADLLGTDANSAGKTVGYDEIYLSFSSMTTGRGNAAFAFDGGLLYATVATTDSGSTYSGEVTGGTGAFTGATGAIAARVSHNTALITITYTA